MNGPSYVSAIKVDSHGSGPPDTQPIHRSAMQTRERLHAELGDQILENKQEAQHLAGQMLHVEAVIKMLNPTYNLRRIAMKRREPQSPTN